jgi:hypothetical protein
MSKLITQTKFQIVLIIILTSLAYSNIFNNNFATDDIGYVFNWKVDKEFVNIPKLFTTDSVPEDERGVYRPVKAVFLLLTYKIWGFNVLGYHLNSLLVHLASTVLVYFISLKVFSSNVAMKQFSNLLAFVTAFLFGLHPIHTESITFILASFDSLGFVFELSSFYLYLKASDKLNTKPSTLYAVSLVFAGLAFFTYELTVTLPLLIILYDYCFRFKLLTHPIRVSTNSKRLKLLIPYFLILGSYFFIRFNLLGLTARGEYLNGSFYTSMLVMSKALIEYIKLLLLPFNLSLNHQIFPGVFSVISKEYMDLNALRSISIFTPEVITSLAVILLLVFLSWRARKKNPLVLFCIAWFFIGLLPASFIFPQSSIMAERYAYLASVGFCLLIALVLVKTSDYVVGLIQKSKIKNQNYNLKLKTFNFSLVLLPFAFLLLTFYGLRTYIRNQDWKDTQTVWEKLVTQNPNDPQANFFLAKIYFENKDFDKSKEYFNKAQKLSSKVSESYYQLGDRVHLIYPRNWEATSDSGVVNLTDPQTGFIAKFELDQKEKSQTNEAYLKKQPDSGLLINEGLAKIPDVDYAFVRIWQDPQPLNSEKMQFFIFKNNLILKILVSPKNSVSSLQFDKLLQNLTFN